MFRKFGPLGALVLSGLLFTAPASASTVTDFFAFQDAEGASIATGSFSYDSSKSGVLSYADLSAFSIALSFAGESYDLAFVNTASNYRYFGYDTASNSFVPAPVAGSTGVAYGILSAANGELTQGFFLDPMASQGGPGSDGIMEAYGHQQFATAASVFIFEAPPVAHVSFAVTTTPLPATLPLFGSGLAGIALLGRRKRRKANAAA